MEEELKSISCIFSCDLFGGYKVAVPKEKLITFQTLDELVTYSVQELHTFLKKNELYFLAEKLKLLKYHIHCSEVKTILSGSVPFVYICSHV